MDGSEEFALEVYDALARRRGIPAAVLTKEELREFWEQLSDQSFDARLQTFFDMYVKLDRHKLGSIGLQLFPLHFFQTFCWPNLCRVDKDADGRITEVEVKEVCENDLFLLVV